MWAALGSGPGLSCAVFSASAAQSALEAHAARGLRTADENEGPDVVEGVGGPVEDREKVGAVVSVSPTLAITMHGSRITFARLRSSEGTHAWKTT